VFSKSRLQFARERFEFRSFREFHFLAEVPDSFVNWLDFQGPSSVRRVRVRGFPQQYNIRSTVVTPRILRAMISKK
jgi:hypothetical protein